MTHTLAAVFDNQQSAEQARQAVLAGGFREHEVQLSGADTGSHSIGSSIKHFFAKLFGDDDDKSDTYAEAVNRGHPVLTVQADSLPELERAADIIEAYGPVDIDERRNEWTSAGWSGGRSAASAAGAAAAGAAAAGSQYLGAQQSATPGASSMGAPDLGGRSDLSGSSELGATAAVGGANDLGATPTIGGMSGIGATASMGSTSSMSATGTAGGSEQRADLGDAPFQGTPGGTAASIQRGTTRIYQRTVATQLGTAGLDDDYYRSHWTSNYAGLGGSYDEFEPAYRYGESMADADSFRGRSWDDAEPGLRSSWESQYPNSAWDKFKAAVRHGWERLTS
ncbi:hypothetical protein [Pseudoduganella sp. UC29_71]|uniref:hypothetical protein n=1 Tax=Pseudoduganella sp. UC29_71 TaxID=3350174 RepID=UPI00366E560F